MEVLGQNFYMKRRSVKTSRSIWGWRFGGAAPHVRPDISPRNSSRTHKWTPIPSHESAAALNLVKKPKNLRENSNPVSTGRLRLKYRRSSCFESFKLEVCGDYQFPSSHGWRYAAIVNSGTVPWRRITHKTLAQGHFSGLSSIPHRYRSAGHSVPYRYRWRSMIVLGAGIDPS